MSERASANIAAAENVARLSVSFRVNGGRRKSVKTYRDLLREVGLLCAGDSMLKKDLVISTWQSYFGAQYCGLTGMSAARIYGLFCDIRYRADHREFPDPFMYIAADCFFDYCNSLPGSFFPGKSKRSSNLSNNSDIFSPVFLNELCKGALHRKSDIVKCVEVSEKSGWAKLVCTCGIAYRMQGDRKIGVSSLTPILYGSRYRTHFRLLISRGWTPSIVAKKLNIAKGTAIGWARKENYSINRGISRRDINELRKEWRLLVLSVLSENRISTAAEVKPILYKKLKLNDREWLKEFNRRNRSWRPKSSYKVNEPTTHEIQEAYLKVLLMEPPIRASQAAILEKIGRRWKPIRDRPSTALLSDLAESPAAFRERVISWLATHASEQRLGTCDEALRRVGMRFRSFTEEQRRRIRAIESTFVVESR